MNILLVYPQYPDTFWSYKHALKFVSKKAAFPPLGALTVAAMLPGKWVKRLIDMNTDALTDAQIKWADYVFVSAMVVQKKSAKEVIHRCKSLGVKVVAGGPLFTTEPEEFAEVDHLVLNEAEINLPIFLSDLEKGCPQRVYTTRIHPEITNTPIPMWSLINMNKYSSMSIQYSRGCPFNCEFCDIAFLDGRNPRTKNTEQIISELDFLYNAGWRRDLLIVDDNFIGNKNKLKTEVLPAIIDWVEKKHHPFAISTEVSINIADDDELMGLMVKADFNRLFVGIETPNEASLSECDKKQNSSRDLVSTVKHIQQNGLEVLGGFIVGFDNDPPSIFKTQIDFIQKSGIVAAMVGILNAPKGTRLHQRLKDEKRLLKDNFNGDNMDFTINFVPKMNRETLFDGYKDILNTIYSPKNYYARITTLIKEFQPKAKAGKSQFKWSLVKGFFNCVWFLGIREKGRRYYWKLFAFTLFTRPRLFPLSMMLSVHGYHFRKVIRENAQSFMV